MKGTGEWLGERWCNKGGQSDKVGLKFNCSE